MTRNEPGHWQDWANVILGMWMFASPPALGFAVAGSLAAPTAWIFGLAIAVFASMALYLPHLWEEVLNVGLGIGLATSPWTAGYAAEDAAPVANAVIVGMLVTAVAIWAMLRGTAIQKWWHARRLHH